MINRSAIKGLSRRCISKSISVVRRPAHQSPATHPVVSGDAPTYAAAPPSKRIVPITNTPYSGAFSERMKRREPAIPMMSPATRASPALRP